jgi:hypothetical protein
MRKYYAVAAATALGLFMRFLDISKISLWHDEAFSALLIRYPWGEMFHRIAEDVHPPLYYIVLRVWSYIFGSSVLSLRGFSAACGTLAVPLTYYIVDKYFANRKAAIISSFLVAVNFFQIYRGSLEARMYTFAILISLLATLALLDALYTQVQGRKNWVLWGLFAVLGASMIYTHYYLSFNLIALGIYALYFLYKNYRFNFREYIPFAAACAGVGILFLPWLKVFHAQLSQVQDVFWIWPMDRWSISNTFWDLTLAFRSGWIPNNILLVLITLFAGMALFALVRYQQSREKWLVLVSVLAPFIGSLIFLLINHLQGHTSSVFLIRYFVLISPFYLVGVALWLASWKRQTWTWLVAGFLILVNLYGFYDFFYSQGAATKPGMAALTKYLNSYANSANDKIIAATPYEYFNLKYYVRTPNSPLLYTYGRPHVSQLAHYDGTALLEDSNLVADLKTGTKAEDTVWMVWTHAYSGDKPLVPANWTQIEERGFDDIQPYPTTLYITEYKVN